MIEVDRIGARPSNYGDRAIRLGSIHLAVDPSQVRLREGSTETSLPRPTDPETLQVATELSVPVVVGRDFIRVGTLNVDPHSLQVTDAPEPKGTVGNRIGVASNNRSKIKEIEALVPKHIEVVHAAGGYDVDETGKSLRHIASQKALAADFDGIVVADDSGLVVPALHDGDRAAPYIHTKRFAEGGEAAVNEKILRKLKEQGASEPEHRRAFLASCIVARVGNELHYFPQRLGGYIALEPREGQWNHGVGTIFIPGDPTTGGFERPTLSEMGLEEKNKISARAQGIRGVLSLMAGANAARDIQTVVSDPRYHRGPRNRFPGHS